MGTHSLFSRIANSSHRNSLQWLQYQDTSHHPLWRSAVYLLRDIAQKIHSWPPSLVITGIIWQGEGGVQPQRSDLHGSFGEVFRAKLQDDQRVAAKRLYLRTDNEKVSTHILEGDLSALTREFPVCIPRGGHLVCFTT
jgi:hypothetical protein